ncbi:hypothetical protein FRC11_008797, partial [Ceratobasidium sp. 423]
MDIVEEHPDFVYSLMLDDEDSPSTRRKISLCIAAALAALYHIRTTPPAIPSPSPSASSLASDPLLSSSSS